MRPLSRRRMLQLFVATPLAAVNADRLAFITGRPSVQSVSLRKSAAALTDSEIALFRHSFELIIKNRVLDQFVAEHGNGEKHQQHEISPGVTTLLQTHLMPEPGGERFLAWHRALLLEIENAMRTAVRESEGEAEARRVFIPYWDFSHTGASIPKWIDEFRPKGIQAVAPAGLPPGHPGFGKEGHTYEVEISRWPGTNPLTPYSPSAKLIRRLLREPDYTRFTRGLEWAPALVQAAPTSEVSRVNRLLSQLGKEGRQFKALTESLQAGAVTERNNYPVLKSLFHLESALAVADVLPGADRNIVRQALDIVTKYFQAGPHTDAHTWVAGHAPRKPAVRGTAVYFHETVADPIFIMLHAEVDRIWATWQASHSGRPDLTGKDATFKPWDGGQTWALQRLLDYKSLPYRYDRLYS